MNPSLIAIHEAGHAVVTCILNIVFEIVSIRPNENSLGRSTNESWDSYNRMERVEGEWHVSTENVQDEVLVYFAGYAAEIRVAPDREDEARLRSGFDDKKAAELLLMVSETDDGPFREKANRLVAQHWNEILLVAHELDHWKELDDAEVETLIGLAKDDEPEAMVDLVRYRVMAQGIENSDDSLQQEYQRLKEVVARLPCNGA